MDMQNVSNLQISEGAVRTIHDKDNRLLWGSVGYDVSFDGNATQTTYSGKNLFSGNFSQFDNIGGTGTLYSYFKLPTEERYTLTLKAKSAISAQSPAKYIGLTSSGGGGGNILWAYTGQAAEAGQVFSIPNIQGTTVLYFCSIYPKNAETLQWFMDNFDIQLELGSTATAYEPYVGGVPAPNPDYPQDVQVVTSAQTVAISDGVTSSDYAIDLTGKNLFDKNNLSDGWLYDNGNILSGGSWKYTNYIPIASSTSYTTSGFANGGGSNPARCYYDANKVFISGVKHNNAAQFVNTSPSNARYMRECCKTADIDTLQIEAGSSASSYAPYYNYELCKIGNYQDYIYKSGDDWYVHKAINKVILNGSEAWAMYPGRNGTFYITKSDIMPATSISATPDVISDYYEPKPFASLYNMIVDYGVANHNAQRWIAIRNKDYSDVSSFKTWLASNNTTVYYVLATPANTKITDATLVGQLDAVHQWATRYGYNTTVSGDLPIVINRSTLS